MLPENIALVTPEQLGCTEELPETQATLEGNSLQKADFLFDHFQTNCFADDTGLEIEALNGEPGVLSARYAGSEKNAEANMKLVLEKLKNEPNRKARFRTVITLIINGKKTFFEGILNGKIIDTPAGSHGFGYDPIFVPEGFDSTLAQMEMGEKNKISHRALAFAKLTKYLNEVA